MAFEETPGDLAKNFASLRYDLTALIARLFGFPYDRRVLRGARALMKNVY